MIDFQSGFRHGSVINVDEASGSLGCRIMNSSEIVTACKNELPVEKSLNNILCLWNRRSDSCDDNDPRIRTLIFIA